MGRGPRCKKLYLGKLLLKDWGFFPPGGGWVFNLGNFKKNQLIYLPKKPGCSFGGFVGIFWAPRKGKGYAGDFFSQGGGAYLSFGRGGTPRGGGGPRGIFFKKGGNWFPTLKNLGGPNGDFGVIVAFLLRFFPLFSQNLIGKRPFLGQGSFSRWGQIFFFFVGPGWGGIWLFINFFFSIIFFGMDGGYDFFLGGGGD